MTRAVVLGVAQDGGIPHAGCDCPRCSAAVSDPRIRQPVACLGLVIGPDGWLLDATPDLPEQWARMRGLGASRLAGIALTHLHVGHYAGLVHLGREAAATRGVPVHAHPDSVHYLRHNRPWADLEAAGHVRYQPFTSTGLAGNPDPEFGLHLRDDTSLEVHPVPHRNDAGPTAAFVVAGPSRRLLYCPDVDRWQRLAAWLQALRVDVALLDGTFFAPEQLPRPEVPHPPMTATLAALAGSSAIPTVLFTHLNHTNPAWEPGPERTRLAEANLTVAAVGDTWTL